MTPSRSNHRRVAWSAFENLPLRCWCRLQSVPDSRRNRQACPALKRHENHLQAIAAADRQQSAILCDYNQRSK